jgi:aldehyde:ferredoxin oxidoreductase
VEVGYELENYPKFFNAVTGLDWTLDNFWTAADRAYSMIKLHYLREFPNVTRKDDYPPAVWFDKANADTDGPQKGVVLEHDKYDSLLQHYYDQRGYDKRGIPTMETLKKLGLEAEAAAAAKVASLN